MTLTKQKAAAACAAAAISVCISGCSILPEEETYPAAPVIQSYEAVTYEQTPVLRGDLVLEEKVQCRYMANRKERLEFAYGGEKIDGVYVEEGQVVHAGDVLAALEENGLDGQIVEQEYLIRTLELKLTHLQEEHELELQQLDAWNTQGTEEYLEAQGAMERKYELAVQDIEDSLYIEQLRLTQMQEENEARNIRAGIDGTVLYAADVEPGQQSVVGEAIITIADMSTNAFCVSGDKSQYFPVGSEWVIEVNNQMYAAVSVEAAVLGVEEEEETAYLQLLEPDPTLENGDKGEITVILAESYDTLYVDKKAVQTAEGRQFVYMLNEDGLRVMQDVTVGLELRNHVEIVSGLEEGDSVILD